MKIYFLLSEIDFKAVKELNRLEEFTLHSPQLVWTWSTYLRLKQKGHNVELTKDMPVSGVVVTNALHFPLFGKTPPGVFLVTNLADTPPPFYSQLNVSQNPYQSSQYPNVLRFPLWHYIPHWPQPEIKKRDSGRKDCFENIAFFGHDDQLDASLRSEAFFLVAKNMGLNFIIRNKAFNDYSDVDAVIAVREFSREPFFYKPASKLVNGWLAGVPVIGGADSAFAALRQSELDYLLVHSKDELLSALQTLKASPELRRQMAQNGLERAHAFTEETILLQWEELLFKKIPLYYEQWVEKGFWEKQLFHCDVFFSRSYRSLKKKLKNRFQ
ncbi:glycosyltransferase [Flavisolibacter ginsenosidimutans]|uniref:Glycosyltransferase family 1 protein n=1 Tax=Flavisolibacter ginsenosidimutans TaxID=661481 RepID=A0A5B8UDY7_9BACT|nr:glycosyltransferase [Flavisolibacter ginsenosidimutans]QEC54887.1 glycosyltransferase family 1 protein [Flavisolibacter ginsenosidimutans]